MQEKINNLRQLISAKNQAVDVVMYAKKQATDKAKKVGSAVVHVPQIGNHTIFVKVSVAKKNTTRWYVNWEMVTQDEMIDLIKDTFLRGEDNDG